MDALEHQAAVQVARARAELADTVGEVGARLIEAEAVLRPASTLATLDYGPVQCGPVVNIDLAGLHRELSQALAHIRVARDLVARMQAARAAAEVPA